MADSSVVGREALALAERWRVAGVVLRRVDPVAFEALTIGAEVMAVASLETAETEEKSISLI